MSNTIKKRCERCNDEYLIVLVRDSKARQKILMYTPCTFCGYISFSNDKINKSGRCSRCSIPFVIIDHHGKGMCKRCHQAYLRENATNK